VIQKVERDGEKLPEIEIKEVTILGERKLFTVSVLEVRKTGYNVKRFTLIQY